MNKLKADNTRHRGWAQGLADIARSLGWDAVACSSIRLETRAKWLRAIEERLAEVAEAQQAAEIDRLIAKNEADLEAVTQVLEADARRLGIGDLSTLRAKVAARIRAGAKVRHGLNQTFQPPPQGGA